MNTHLTSALKEWSVAVNALEAGKTILLLRKGGIREDGGSFKVKSQTVWLYPTFEHQKPELLKPEYASQVVTVASGWHPETVRIGAYAEIAETFLVANEAAIKALQPFHIWNEEFVRDRLQWKHKQPICLLLLRVYKLRQAQIIPYLPEYGGCKSWIELSQPISTADAIPVLSDRDCNQQANAIRQTLANPV